MNKEVIKKNLSENWKLKIKKINNIDPPIKGIFSLPINSWCLFVNSLSKKSNFFAKKLNTIKLSNINMLDWK